MPKNRVSGTYARKNISSKFKEVLRASNLDIWARKAPHGTETDRQTDGWHHSLLLLPIGMAYYNSNNLLLGMAKQNDDYIRLTAVFRTTWLSRYQNFSILYFITAKDDGGGGDNCSCKTCKAPIKSSPPTNPALYRPDALPVAKPTASAMKGELAHLLGFPTLSLTIKGSWLSWGGLPNLLSAL